MSTLKTIDKIEQNLANIRSAVNETKGETVLTDASLLSDYADAIRQLGAQIASTNQQLIVLYTYAANDEEAALKTIPAVSWPKSSINEDGEEEGGKIIINILDENGWVPSSPIKPVGENSRLYIRFASIFYGESEIQEKNLGIPILLEGKDGDQGPQGDPGTDAVVIGLTQFRTMTLYNTQANKPDVPVFKFDTNQFAINNGDLIDYLYYVTNSGKKYIKEEDSEWKLSIPAETYAWEVSISFKSSHEAVDILSGPLYNIPAISETKIEYCLSATETVGNEWMEIRPAISNEYPYLFCRIKTKYTTGYEFYSTPILLEEMPIVILNIETLYGVSSDVSIKPVEWSPIAAFGPVIWKKETTTYNRNIGENSNVNVTIAPISVQGPAGIQIIGKIDSVSELPTSLTYDSSYIGRIGVIVQSDTYIWYGSEDPNLECEKIGDYYWLNIGPLGNAGIDWNASEGEDGFIKNRTHYAKDEQKTIIVPTGEGDQTFTLPANARTISVWLGTKNWIFIYPREVRVNTTECEIKLLEHVNNTYTFSVAGITEDLKINYRSEELTTLDPKFCSGVYEVTYAQLCELRNNYRLVENAKYKITDYPNMDITVLATSTSTISKYAVAFNPNENKAYDIEYTLDNDISSSYILHGEPFSIDVYGYSTSDADTLRSQIMMSDRKINFVKGATYNMQGEEQKITIRRRTGTVPLIIGTWTPDSGQSLSLFINRTFFDLTDVIKNTTLLIYCGEHDWLNKDLNETYNNPHWLVNAEEHQTQLGTILKYHDKYENEIPFDPNFYISDDIPVNIDGRSNKILSYYDHETRRFLIAPIYINANNVQTNVFDLQRTSPSDNENTRLS